ncbi:ATP-binding protein [Streptomyces sp. NPDC059909]|uniref:ATP-binding protein n=1 Tax=Streptomyces sp. NPDC059909 TaxID=3346998 RepID=UPI00364E00BD
MDPMNRGPEEYGHDNDRFDDGERERDGAAVQRPPRDAVTVTPEFAQKTPVPARTARIVSGDLLLTVNPVDGSEIEPCPPGQRPTAPARHSTAERKELRRAGRPPVPPGPAAPPLPLLEREEERERLLRLLGRGRSVRLTGPAGSGRTTLLDIVAAQCTDLAPDGVVRVSGHHRTPTELLYELFAAVHSAPQHRPDRSGLLELVRGIGAVVIVDDLEFGGSALDELLDATPECAFLLAATPDVSAPSPDSHLEEVFLKGLGRSAALQLLERAVERSLTDEEANWAGDLWFESEGLPLRFVQAGALLRQRDALRVPDAEPDPDDDGDNVFADGHDAPLPTLGEGAAPAALLASRLSESARDALRFAVALGGEVPHQAHLPALVGDTHADAALGELTSCGLLTPVGSRYRLAAGVAAQLEAAGYGEGAVERAHTAAQHYAWWAGHASVSPERAAAEADAVLASMAALVPGRDPGHPSAAVLLARSAAPAFASGLHWGAWERALRTGQEAARISGEVAEEAYFHHELGVLALCAGNLDRARAELEASIAMRGALADKRGTVAGRRALALVADRAGGLVPGGRTPAAEEVPAARHEESASPLGGIPAIVPREEPLVTRSDTAEPLATKLRRTVLTGARRNVVAAGAGALLAAVLGTVVTLGATSNPEDPADRVTNEQSANEDDGEDGLNADEPTQASTNRPSGAPAPSNSSTPTDSGASDTPAAPAPTTPTDDPTDTGRPTSPGSPRPTTSPTPKPTQTPPRPTGSTPTPTPTTPTTPPTSTTPTPTETSTTGGSNSLSNSASASLSTAPSSSESATV